MAKYIHEGIDLGVKRATVYRYPNLDMDLVTVTKDLRSGQVDVHWTSGRARTLETLDDHIKMLQSARAAAMMEGLE